ncbi:hypothetical protein SVAN01_08794 [Stagonosporopsis vannaccii]|nr:hypothetical protein SVAN01_08794 [Stagonosporopsis vannaccii]
MYGHNQYDPLSCPPCPPHTHSSSDSDSQQPDLTSGNATTNNWPDQAQDQNVTYTSDDSNTRVCLQSNNDDDPSDDANNATTMNGEAHFEPVPTSAQNYYGNIQSPTYDAMSSVEQDARVPFNVSDQNMNWHSEGEVLTYTLQEEHWAEYSASPRPNAPWLQGVTHNRSFHQDTDESYAMTGPRDSPVDREATSAIHQHQQKTSVTNPLSWFNLPWDPCLDMPNFQLPYPDSWSTFNTLKDQGHSQSVRTSAPQAMHTIIRDVVQDSRQVQQPVAFIEVGPRQGGSGLLTASQTESKLIFQYNVMEEIAGQQTNGEFPTLYSQSSV